MDLPLPAVVVWPSGKSSLTYPLLKSVGKGKEWPAKTLHWPLKVEQVISALGSVPDASAGAGQATL